MISKTKIDCCKVNFRSDYDKLVINLKDLTIPRVNFLLAFTTINSPFKRLTTAVNANPIDITGILNATEALLNNAQGFNFEANSILATNIQIIQNLNLLLSDFNSCNTCCDVDNVLITLQTANSLNTSLVTLTNTLLDLVIQSFALNQLAAPLLFVDPILPEDVAKIKALYNLIAADISIINSSTSKTDYDKLISQLKVVIDGIIKCGLTNTCVKIFKCN